jgi:hypothetical protein
MPADAHRPTGSGPARRCGGNGRHWPEPTTSLTQGAEAVFPCDKVLEQNCRRLDDCIDDRRPQQRFIDYVTVSAGQMVEERRRFGWRPRGWDEGCDFLASNHRGG